MSHYPLDELIERWKHKKLTAEQMIGQILLVLGGHDRRFRELARRALGESGNASAEAGDRRRDG